MRYNAGSSRTSLGDSMSAEPIRTIKNQYRGINAHLHSYWQGRGEWNNFHNVHVSLLTSALRKQLLPMGYTARMEESLQIRRFSDDRPYEPIADVIDRSPYERAASAMPSVGAHTVAELLALPEDHEHPYFAVMVYKLREDSSDSPIGWLELLSPSNKRPHHDSRTYLDKRLTLLQQGIVFIELDYLHETPPTFPNMMSYSDPRQRDYAHPYRVAVLDPRPDILSGPAQSGEFDVDSPIPTMHIPLSGDDSLMFDFDAIYQHKYEEMVYGLEYVDYRVLPLHFDRYSRADQTRIACRMLAIREAVQRGDSLEGAPLPACDVPLEEALMGLGV